MDKRYEKYYECNKISYSAFIRFFAGVLCDSREGDRWSALDGWSHSFGDIQCSVHRREAYEEKLRYTKHKRLTGKIMKRANRRKIDRRSYYKLINRQKMQQAISSSEV